MSREGALHKAVCEAVIHLNIGENFQASHILRAALVEYADHQAQQPAAAVPPDEAPKGNGEFGANGITVRQYFAAKAMGALIVTTQQSVSLTRNDLCAEAYQYADAMLAAAKKENNNG